MARRQGMVRGGMNWAALSGALVAAAVCARGADSERGFTTETQRHREERTSQRSGRAFAPVLLCASAPLWCDADDPPIAEGGPVGQQLSGDIPLLADKPDRVIELPDAESVESIAFLPDGKSLIVHIQVRAINVWELLHHYWPEEIGALLAIAVLVLIRAAVHVRMHPQRKGEPHCRGCGYCLTGVAPGPCPECGLDKRAGTNDKGRVIGRSALRRLRWALVPVVVIGAVYGGLFAAGVGRWSRAYEGFEWWSVSLSRAAKRYDQAWLLSRCETTSRSLTVPKPVSVPTEPVAKEDYLVRAVSSGHQFPGGTSNIVGTRTVMHLPGCATLRDEAMVRFDESDWHCLLALPGVRWDVSIRPLSLSPDGSEFAAVLRDSRPQNDANRPSHSIAVFRLPRGTKRLQ